MNQFEKVRLEAKPVRHVVPGYETFEETNLDISPHALILLNKDIHYTLVSSS